MAQEVKTMVRPSIGGTTPAYEVDQELSYLGAIGWELFETHYLGMSDGGHNMMYILVRETEKAQGKTPDAE